MTSTPPPTSPKHAWTMRLVPVCAVLAAALASMATPALPPPPVLYPRAYAVWQFDQGQPLSRGPQQNAQLRKRAVCAELVGAVTRSGKEGFAITLRAVPDDPGTPCPLDQLRADITLIHDPTLAVGAAPSGAPTVAGEARALTAEDGTRYHDVVFAFDNAGAWNAGLRHATLRLSGQLAGEPFAFETLALRHARPADHLAMPNPSAHYLRAEPPRPPDQAGTPGERPAPVTTSPFQGAPR